MPIRPFGERPYGHAFGEGAGGSAGRIHGALGAPFPGLAAVVAGPSSVTAQRAPANNCGIAVSKYSNAPGL